MSRSLKKGPFVDAKLMQKAQKAKAAGSRVPIKTWSRASTITPDMVGLTFAVHNGKTFISVFADENMVGHRLGEFSPTRKFIAHGGKMAKDEAKDGAKAAPDGVSRGASASPAGSPKVNGKK